MSVKQYCTYYQARVARDRCWFFVGVLRSFENIAFDRTLDKDLSLLEFFVAPDREQEFLALMEALEEREVVSDLQKMENRFLVN